MQMQTKQYSKWEAPQLEMVNHVTSQSRGWLKRTRLRSWKPRFGENVGCEQGQGMETSLPDIHMRVIVKKSFSSACPVLKIISKLACISASLLEKFWCTKALLYMIVRSSMTIEASNEILCKNRLCATCVRYGGSCLNWRWCVRLRFVFILMKESRPILNSRLQAAASSTQALSFFNVWGIPYSSFPGRPDDQALSFSNA